ncbi:MAG: hypothetical protein PWP31_1230 [Clostridia bacterium]|nr:hypothetical protein [Clostridia bacterium]
MKPLGLILVALALGTDAFSLATGLALGGFRGRRVWLFIGTVALLHIIMPLIGLYLGMLLGLLLGRVAGIIGAIVLAVMGIMMVWEAFKSSDEDEKGGLVGQIVRIMPGGSGVISGMTAIILMAGSVSLDALSVGFSLGALSVNVPLTVVTLGVIAGSMTFLGFFIGRHLGGYLGNRAEIVGGLVLVAVGVKMLVGG